MTVARSVADVLDDHVHRCRACRVPVTRPWRLTSGFRQRPRTHRSGRRGWAAAGSCRGLAWRHGEGVVGHLYPAVLHVDPLDDQDLAVELDLATVKPTRPWADRPPGREGAGERPGESTGGGADHVVQRRGVLGELTPWSRYFCDQRFRAHARRAGWSRPVGEHGRCRSRQDPRAFRLSWHEGASSGCSPWRGSCIAAARSLAMGAAALASLDRGEPRCRSNRFALAHRRVAMCGARLSGTLLLLASERESA